MSARVRSASRTRSTPPAAPIDGSSGRDGPTSDGCAATALLHVDGLPEPRARGPPSVPGPGTGVTRIARRAGGPALDVVPSELTHHLVHRSEAPVSRTSSSSLVGLVGTGIGPSLTPALHEREADRLGIRYLYRRLDLDVLGRPASAIGEILAAARLAGYDGLNITHPCKQLVLEHLDELSPDSAALGAVNTVVLRDGRAVGGSVDEVADALSTADGLAHATPTGMAAHPGLPLPAELLRPELWVADIVYRPLETALVQTARERGCRVLDGGGMAVYQAVDAFRLFTGVEPDAGRMLVHFTTLVSGPGHDVRVG